MSESHEFKAEVAALLNLVTNSLYTNSEIFLRELISNAADAIDKARFQALVDTDFGGKELEPHILITANKQAGTLTIEDTGIGMTREEAGQNLGTIAHSGTLRYLDELQKARASGDVSEASELNLIGQFGVGFYSAFMVADKVSVTTLSGKAGSEAVVWTSAGDGRYSLEPGAREHRGTSIVLELKEEAKEFLDRWRLDGLIKRYSNYIIHPIKVRIIDDQGEDKDPEPKQINAASAIWARSSSELEDKDYEEFYKHVMGGFVMPGDEPFAKLHFSADAPIQFHALLYVPGRAPADLFQEDRKALQLFAKRVMIMESCDTLLPQYLRFVRGVVDSQDLPLNVSREILQENKSLAAIRRQLTRKVLKLLASLADEEPEKYAKLWAEFGPVIKEGLHLDGGQRDQLQGLLRYRHVNDAEGGLLSLAAYVEAMGEDQQHIWYIAGQNESALRNSPHLEAVRAKGQDVLLMTDAVDEWVLQSLSEFEGKSFRSVTQGELEDEASKDEGEDKEDGEDKDEEAKDSSSPIDPLLNSAKVVLGARVRDVRASKRLTESPSCLVDAAGGLSRNMERILRMAQPGSQMSASARILELNPDHPFVKAASKLSEANKDDPRLPDWIEILHDLASLAEGEVPDPAGAAKRFQKVLNQVASEL